MTAKAEPEKDLLRRLFSYENATGHLVWCTRPPEDFATKRACDGWNSRFPGTVAGYVSLRGYRIISVSGVQYRAHRLVWAFHHGSVPEELDHINRRRSDNRLQNLRPATRSENNRNIGLRADNRSGVPGVYWSAKNQRWVAQIKVEGRNIGLGWFADKFSAITARHSGELKHFGNFRGGSEHV